MTEVTAGHKASDQEPALPYKKRKVNKAGKATGNAIASLPLLPAEHCSISSEAAFVVSCASGDDAVARCQDGREDRLHFAFRHSAFSDFDQDD